ncbi:uncharacterized protein LOC134286510 [Aedes albopictus]|uniref:DUF5641 domain-containing protein n=1 Tax=Aedes albopictus TaxID=7160 RepID=A0ABM2A5B3_AEDAL
MHVFVDASESAMSAVVFLRLVEGDQVECSLIAGKTRVAPLKYTSIPRLELQAAVLGCRLAKSVTENLTMNISTCTYWTASQNVLCWLRADHKRYSAFVGSRISEIQESTDVREWRWVPTRSNVADDATRWRDRPDLSADSRWFKGPEFLMQAEEDWPTLPLKSLSTDEEIRPSVLLHFKVPEPAIDVGRYSSWRRLLAVTGYVLRFCSNLQRRRSKESITIGPLTSEKLRGAEEYHYRQAQRDVYPDEVAALETKEDTIKRISKASPLYKLSPFGDDFGVNRMKGRTTVCAYLHSDAKNPVILPPKHPVTTLVLIHYHEKYLHRNYEIAVNEVRQKYSIFRLRQALAAIRRNYVDTAALRRGHPTSQWLANLFWKRWVRDYLSDITRRTKWHEKAKPLQVGDVVVIVDQEHPRNCWPKGRVIGVTSSGGQTRKATVQTVGGIYE